MRKKYQPGRLASQKKMAKAVRNGSGVTNRNSWQYSQDTFNGDDVENWFLAVEVKHAPSSPTKIRQAYNPLLHNAKKCSRQERTTQLAGEDDRAM